jgi:hypothetical protein
VSPGVGCLGRLGRGRTRSNQEWRCPFRDGPPSPRLNVPVPVKQSTLAAMSATPHDERVALLSRRSREIIRASSSWLYPFKVRSTDILPLASHLVSCLSGSLLSARTPVFMANCQGAFFTVSHPLHRCPVCPLPVHLPATSRLPGHLSRNSTRLVQRCYPGLRRRCSNCSHPV